MDDILAGRLVLIIVLQFFFKIKEIKRHQEKQMFADHILQRVVPQG